MIDLYKLHWSHYVEKVRWALDFKGLAWRGIDIVAFTKKEMQRFDCPQLVPLLHDTATGVAISDSSPIIRYLDETYSERPLLPQDPLERERAWQWMLHLDSTLGHNARRLGYTQVIMECPNALSALFMPLVANGLFTRHGWRALAAPVLGTMLSKRFRMDRNREDRVYESLEAQLLSLASRLHQHEFLIGDRFSAVDLTLACFLRPLRIVPYFRDHPDLQTLFAWQGRLLREHLRDETFLYEDLILAQRQRRGTMHGEVGWMRRERPASVRVDDEIAPLDVANNDQQAVNRWTLLLGLPGYLKLRWFNGVGRVPFHTPLQPSA